MRLNHLLCLITVLLLGSTQAQELLTPEKAIEIAIENNVGIQISMYTRTVAENAVSYGNAGMLPTVDLNTSYSGSVNNSKLEFAAGPAIEDNGLKANRISASLDVNWTIFDGFGMFYTYDKLSEQSALVNLQEQEKLESTVAQVLVTYFDILRLQQQVRLREAAIESSAERLAEINQLLALGASTVTDQIVAQSALATDSSSLLVAERNLKSAQMDLNYYLGVAAERSFELPNNLELMPPHALDSLMGETKTNNTLLRQSKANITISELDYKIYKSAIWPRVFVSAGYSFGRSENEASITEFSRNTGVNYGIGLSWNLFDGFRKQMQIKNGEYGLENAKLEQKDIELRIDKDVKKAMNELEMSFRQMTLETRNVALFEKQYTHYQELRKLGKVTPLEVRQTQLQLFEAQNRLLNSQIEAKMSEVELLRLAGRLVR